MRVLRSATTYLCLVPCPAQLLDVQGTAVGDRGPDPDSGVFSLASSCFWVQEGSGNAERCWQLRDRLDVAQVRCGEMIEILATPGCDAVLASGLHAFTCTTPNRADTSPTVFSGCNYGAKVAVFEINGIVDRDVGRT